MADLRKILVVDDNEEFLQNTKDILELAGYEVLCASDPLKGLEQARLEHPDLILMDIRLPIMDGVEAYERIRETTPEVPVIMMTAYSVDDLVVKALHEGAFGALIKPLDFDQLLPIIDRALGHGPLLLIVDDDAQFCASMADVLEQNGYRVDVAYDSETAISKTSGSSFDVLVLDLKLPTMDGMETYHAIRARRPNATAIFVTGYPEEAAKLAAAAARGGELLCCLQKPVDLDRLLGGLQELPATP